ncbi:hypothetical protein [Marinobacter antarcticus]|uniref:hypothetical protein n=1 Tax=Marinobacter antarcticus TaxID=564117 RepID=UPI0026F053BE|nr:hypothetical protein [Marinobacter antarcticus]
MVVLKVGVVSLADGRHPQRHQIAIRVGGVALEVPVQAAGALRHGKAVIRFGKCA